MLSPAFRAVAVFGLMLSLAGPTWSQEADNPPPGVEVLAQGPVHEAYAAPVNQTPPASPMVPRTPPEPIPELPPEQKPEGEHVQWVPGYWSWDVDRNDFVWVSGFWRTPPPGRQWVPGHWQKVEGGWQWVAGFWSVAGRNQLEFLPPPPAPLEISPSVPAPFADSFYLPGCWVYQENRYYWRPGVWGTYRPGWLWVPAHYSWTPSGCLFVEGYWDYPLAERGLLFAPLYCSRPVYTADFPYVPRWAVATNFLFSALFARPASCHYYFGDYFTARYAGLGFVPWYDCRFGRGFSDPLYRYYGHQHRGGPWDRDLRDHYAARYDGRAPRPPRTLVQQNTLIQNIEKNATKVNATNIEHVRALAPLNQVAKVDNRVRLENIDRDRRTQAQQAGERLRETARDRQQLQANLLAKGDVPSKPADPPRRVKLDLPKSVATPPIDRAPPLPNRPAQAERPSKPEPRPPEPPRKDVTPPPRKEVTPPRDLTPPKKEVTPPAAPPDRAKPPSRPAELPRPIESPKKEVTPPSTRDASPPAPPPDRVKPPSRPAELPRPIEPPPKKEVTPPSPRDVTPKKEVTPPPDRSKAPSRPAEPPKKEVSPTPRPAEPPRREQPPAPRDVKPAPRIEPPRAVTPPSRPPEVRPTVPQPSAPRQVAPPSQPSRQASPPAPSRQPAPRQVAPPAPSRQPAPRQAAPSKGRR